MQLSVFGPSSLCQLHRMPFAFPTSSKGLKTWSAGYLEVGHIASMITSLTREIKVTKFHSQPPANHTSKDLL